MVRVEDVQHARRPLGIRAVVEGQRQRLGFRAQFDGVVVAGVDDGAAVANLRRDRARPARRRVFPAAEAARDEQVQAEQHRDGGDDRAEEHPVRLRGRGAVVPGQRAFRS
ncbi:hypothetical protein QP939_48825 [Amycolatopsis nalaikhensis]|uniref:Uncharacterized protein n=1 Tax=Amycolatopsis nalaikhensis TaxID=715472 RepID=A0ABY8XLY1_9PSEU|nr:hypothetical protein [Amycolatopsis sp. 2-2]WIV56603.1 hypothetical protein QP939_48825 [Amycolatopsis sp. 2-2]